MSQDIPFEAPQITGNLPPAFVAAMAAQKNLQKQNAPDNNSNSFPDPNQEGFPPQQPNPIPQQAKPRATNFVPPKPQMQASIICAPFSTATSEFATDKPKLLCP